MTGPLGITVNLTRGLFPDGNSVVTFEQAGSSCGSIDKAGSRASAAAANPVGVLPAPC